MQRLGGGRAHFQLYRDQFSSDCQTVWDGSLLECNKAVNFFVSPSDVWKLRFWAIFKKYLAKNSHRMIEYSAAWQSFRFLNLTNPLESHFSFNKKCFVGRTVMIQCALHSPDLTERFTYSERVHTTHRKISAGFWSQRLRQKVTQNDRTFWSLTELQKPQLQKSTRKSLLLQ